MAEKEKVTITVPKGVEIEVKTDKEEVTKKDESDGNGLQPMNEVL